MSLDIFSCFPFLLFFLYLTFRSLLENKIKIKSPLESATYWRSAELIRKKYFLNYTTRWQSIIIDDNDGGVSWSTGTYVRSHVHFSP